jgi:hypothetical protein
MIEDSKMAANLERRQTGKQFRILNPATGDDVTASLSLSVLAVIPVMTTQAERRKVKRRRIALATASLAISVAIAVIVAWRLGLVALGVR